MSREIVLSEMCEREIPLIYERLHLRYVDKYCKEKEKEMRGCYINWYQSMLNSPHFIVYTVKNKKNEFMGTLKFHIDGKNAVVDIFLDRDFRGKGLSETILKMGMAEVQKNEKTKVDHEIESFLAYIIKENEISKHLFEKMGFQYVRNANYNGIRHMLYEKRVEKK